MSWLFWGLFLLNTCTAGTMLYINIKKTAAVDILTNIYNRYLQHIVDTYTFTIFTKYSAFKTNTVRTIQYIYNCHPFVTNITDRCIYGFQWAHSTYYQLQLEPFHHMWISQNYLMGDHLQFRDSYLFIYDDSTHSAIYSFLHHLNTMKFSFNNIQLNRTYVDKLLYARYNNHCISRVKMDNHIPLLQIDDFTKLSSIKFLSVCVTVKGRKYHIDVDKSWMRVNNELFSITFLKRYFEYHNIICQVDIDYIVNIMDNNINMFQLKYGEYILLHENKYDILQHSIFTQTPE